VKKTIVVAGVFLAGIALFSVQLGLDNDAGWGGKRKALLVIGLILILAGAFFSIFGEKITNVFKELSVQIEKGLKRSMRIKIAALISTAVVIVLYFWFAQLNQRDANHEYNYYVELAKSFKSGHLYLAVEPPPELLALENPYDYFTRREKHIDNFPWDLSLYKGKFYIYWGPTPAVLASIFGLKLLNQLGDFHLALALAGGLLIYQALILSVFWIKTLNHAPAWLLGALLIVVGSATPILIMLNRAKVYDASIFSGQFFLVGGCYWAYSALQEDSPSRWKLTIASIHWALSAGSRIILLPAILFCAGITMVYIYHSLKSAEMRSIAPCFLAVLMPLALGGIALALYNWARFDSVFEFGLKYQLANVDYTHLENIFAPSRIPANFKLYLMFPMKIFPRFPYLARIEDINSNERLAGLFYLSPYISLIILPLLQAIKQIRTPFNFSDSESTIRLSDSWLLYVFLGSGLITLLIILSFYYPAMRYIEDFMPVLFTLITIHVGRQYDILHGRIVPQRMFLSITLALAAITIIANLLIAMPVDGTKFAVNLLNAINKLLGLK
jgi:hypothetical protein